MAERFLVVDHLKLGYEGLFNASELYNLIAEFFFTKHWDWREKLNMEQITPQGKQLHLVLEPWKSATDYYKIIIKMTINMNDVKDVDVEHNGATLRLNQGTVRITFDGIVLADRNDQWTHNPVSWFFTILGQKYFFRDHFRKMEVWVKGDLEDLHGRIKSYLNTFKYTYQS